jgi:hypothetical protein
VLVTVGGVWATFSLMLLLGTYVDSHEEGQQPSLTSTVKELFRSDSIKLRRASLFIGKPRKVDQSQSRSKVLDSLKLIDDSLPSIFKSDSLWNKFKEEMKVYHRWLGIVFYYSPEFPRAMRVLFSSIVIMLFVQSVTYNIADPDDGSCESCEDESCCLSLESTLNVNEDRCSWEDSSSTNSTGSEGSCHFREIDGDMTRMFIVVMISTVVSAPFALSIQYLIMNVLSKDIVTEKEEQKKLSLSSSPWSFPRRLSVSPETGGSDRYEFLKDWSAYSEHLQFQDAQVAATFRSEYHINLLSFATHLRRCLGPSFWSRFGVGS